MDEDNPIRIVFTLELRIEIIDFEGIEAVGELAENAMEYGTVRVASVEFTNPGDSDGG